MTVNGALIFDGETMKALTKNGEEGTERNSLKVTNYWFVVLPVESRRAMYAGTLHSLFCFGDVWMWNNVL